MVRNVAVSKTIIDCYSQLALVSVMRDVQGGKSNSPAAKEYDIP